MCCRVTCWRRPLRGGSAPQWTASRLRSTRRPHPRLRPRPEDRQPPWGLQKMAADIPGHTPRSGRLGSCGQVPVCVSWLPKENSRGGTAQTQKLLEACLPRQWKEQPRPVYQERGEPGRVPAASPPEFPVSVRCRLPVPPQLLQRLPRRKRDVLWTFLCVVIADDALDLPLNKFCCCLDPLLTS